MAVKALTKLVRHLLQPLAAAVPPVAPAVRHVPINDEAIVVAMIAQRYEDRDRMSM